MTSGRKAHHHWHIPWQNRDDLELWMSILNPYKRNYLSFKFVIPFTHYEERMSCWLEDPIFCHRVLNFILLDDDFFLENFNCIKVIRRLLTTENHFSKSTLSQNFQELEIFKLFFFYLKFNLNKVKKIYNIYTLNGIIMYWTWYNLMLRNVGEKI